MTQRTVIGRRILLAGAGPAGRTDTRPWLHAVALAGACTGLMLVAGCGSAVDGAGRPAVAAASESGSTSPSTAATVVPTDATTSAGQESAAPLDAAGIDPCALLDDTAQGELGVTDHGPADTPNFNGATCRFVVDGQSQFNATATDGLTLDQLVAASDAQGRISILTSIRGFDAALSQSSSDPTMCTAAIGVSPTGIIVVTYQLTTASDEDETCGRARTVADHTVDGLIAQQ